MEVLYIAVYKENSRIEALVELPVTQKPERGG